MPSLHHTVDMSEWSTFMREARSRVDNLTPVHDETIGPYLVQRVHENFRSSGGAEKWAPLAPATLTPSRLRYGAWPLLKTLSLVNAITHRARAAYVDVGSLRKYAPALFFGSTKNNTPARSPFAFLDSVLDAIGPMYVKFIFGRTLH